jgi:hypothetical protein
MLHSICSSSLPYYALCPSVSKGGKFAIASKSIFKFHHQKTSCLPGGAVGARDRAWQIKKVLERNNVEEEGKRNFFNRLEATPVGKLKLSAVGFSAKPISAAISALRHHQLRGPRKPPITPPCETTLICEA